MGSRALNPSLILSSLQNSALFKRPTSKKARRLLECMMEWSALYTIKIWGGHAAFAKDFEANYDPFVYDDVCHRFKVDSYFPLFSKSKIAKEAVPGGAPKTKEDLLRAMNLAHFENEEWLAEHEILPNDRRVQTLGNREVYLWLTERFLITDFSEDDLNKIAMMGNEKYGLDLIQREAARITDVQKRSISYLYAIVRDVAAREEYARAGAHAAQARNDEAVKRLFDLEKSSKDKLAHPLDPDMRSRWERERAFIELARDLKNE